MNTVRFDVYLNTKRQKGNLAYEYNPLYNYQTDVDLYIYDNKYIIPKGQAINIKNGELLVKKGNNWIDKRGKVITTFMSQDPAGLTSLWAKEGSLIDMDTEKLNFDLEHPVEIEVQPSYDGSVNLILNDDKNIPRLINSRFSVREKDTYEIVDRIGENDTNIYNSKTFDKDTSLYFQYEYNPHITYLGFVKGVLPVGQYCFYFTYCDADENESDFIAESGLIPVFIGNDTDPQSMDGGIKNQLSNKGISLKLTNIDKSYNYLKVYYVRYFADYNQNRVYECKKIYKKYSINSNVLYLQINGTEDAEDLDANVLNLSRFNPKHILTQAQCKNMLFFGNIVKNSDNYKELTDLALRIVPRLNVVNNFDKLNDQYVSENGEYTYYNSLNIYNKTGYFNQEYYRFGVVFIYQNGTLSNVYNTLGGNLDDEDSLNLSGELYTVNPPILVRNYVKVDDDGWVKDDSTYEISGKNINGRGVCQFDYSKNYDDKTIFSVKFKVPKEVCKLLKEDLGIRGLFFVRQKCVPNILAQCYLLGMDEELEAPILEETINETKKHYTECFISNSLTLDHNHSSRLYEYKHETGPDKKISSLAYAGLCPDFQLNQPYYNQIFNGGKFRLQKVSVSGSELTRDNRFFNEGNNVIYSSGGELKRVTICTVTEDVNTVAIQDKTFRLEIGECEESFRFKYAEIDNGKHEEGKVDYEKDGDTVVGKYSKATNLVRGKYSPYLAIYSNNGALETGCLYNIYQDYSINTRQEFQDRMNSSEPFYAISDRHNLITNYTSEYVCWRGDCYINQFSHRMSRNFNDPSLPNNDDIIDPDTWKDNYKINDSTKWADISRSDVNAVQIGSWITFKVRSAMNYALRSVDHSYVAEEALMGSPRSFYPRSKLLQRGENKLPDSYLYNDAYRASLGFKCYFTLQDVNYIKDTFSNRIQYSAIAIQDSFKNNYRYSLTTYFRDYSQEYGSIQKLVGFEGYLLVVFEHAIGIAVVNERVLAGNGDGEPVFINTENVLPEELTIISDTYGTQWGDSVIKSEMGYVYGVDTNAKKIWRVKGQQIEILSDFKVNKFLIDNISLGERELYPTIGLRDVKTHYNNNKKDIMFTFYDDIYKDEERVWNLCYNELIGEFITFYSWVPSFSENIDTKFFSFDRNTSKCLSLLAKCNYNIPENTGILIENPLLTQSNSAITCDTGIFYCTPDKSKIVNYTLINSDGTTELKTITMDTDQRNSQNILQNVKFKLEKDHWGNYKYFTVGVTEYRYYETVINEQTHEPEIIISSSTSLPEGITDSDIIETCYGIQLRNNTQDIRNEVIEMFNKQKVVLLYVTPYLEGQDIIEVESGTVATTYFQTELIAFALKSTLENPLLTSYDKQYSGLTTDFYLHGQAGLFNIKENLYPTHWYGEYHPFEFEFVVNDKVAQQKIFNDLLIISNKAEPESFHFEIEGDNYEFSEDKRTMYFRQEATKNLYQNLGSDVLYNRYYTDVVANNYTHEQYYRGGTDEYTGRDYSNYKDQYNKEYNFDRVYPVYSHQLVQQVKSTMFPLYYERVDTYNDIYHKYQMMKPDDASYDFQNLSGSEVSWNRDLNQFNIITHIKNRPIDLYGRLRGNSRYKEGKWHVQIPSITFMQKNEEDWPTVQSESYGNDLMWDGPLKEHSTYRIPPLIINSQFVPKDIENGTISMEELPNIYVNKIDNGNDISHYNVRNFINTGEWTPRKEARIRDKWIKIRVRYSGKNLAIIHSIATLYNISYS